MTDERKLDIITRAIETYGEQRQIDMMIEEASELTKALLKLRRRCSEPGWTQDLSDVLTADILGEIADCKIMLAQMELIFGDASVWVELKLERLEGRLDGTRHD